MISIIKIIAAVATIVFASQYSFNIPLGEQNIIPITLQSLAVLCWAVFLRPMESFVAIGTYIALGVFANLPVFANGASGMEVLQGDTAGYIYGFWVAAVVVSWVRNPYRRETIPSLLLLMIIGTALIIIGGLMYLSRKYGVLESFDMGFYPIWKGAVVKIILGTILCYIIDKIIIAAGMSPYKDKKKEVDLPV